MRYGAEIINLVIGYYFAAIGVFSVGRLVNDGANIVVGFIFPNYFRYKSSLSDKHGVLMRVIPSQREVIRQDGTAQLEKATGLPVPNPLLNLNLPKWMRNALWSLRRSFKQKYIIKGYFHNILEFALNLTLINVVSGCVGLGIILYVNTISKLWFFTNLQGFALSYQALQLLSPTSFTTGSLILSALFFYDIWAVFFTPLMVGVAKNLHQPIALVFPRPAEPSAVPGEPPVKSFSMLGLGDIVIPGLLIGLALRFDLYMFYLKKQSTDKKKATYVSVTGRWGDKFWTSGLPNESLPAHLKTSFPKPYFITSVIGYVAGMVTTLAIMTVFHHAQPALLYLVPGVLLSLWSTALIRGEFKHMWEFSEAVTAEQLEVDGGEKKKAEEAASKEKSNRGLFRGMWYDLWHGSDENKTKAEEKKVDKSAESKSVKSKKQSEDMADAKSKDKGGSGLLFSFSISRLQNESTASSKTSSTEQKSNFKLEKTDSAAHSESSEDPVFVESADLDGTNEVSKDGYCIILCCVCL